MDDIPYTITIVGNCEMILKLVEAHFHRLTSIIEETRVDIPRLTACNTLQRLCLLESLLVACPPPQARVVIVATGLIRFVWLHLRLAKVLQVYQQKPYQRFNSVCKIPQ